MTINILKISYFFDFFDFSKIFKNFSVQKNRFSSGENFRSWWWRSVSSPLQVSGAVTRLAVYRAAPHNLQRRGYYSGSNLQRRGYYSGSNIPSRTSAEKASAQFRRKFGQSFESRWNFHNSFSPWFQSSCSLGCQRGFLKVSGRLKFSRQVKSRNDGLLLRGRKFSDFFYKNFRFS